MSGAAERGDVDWVILLLDEFGRNDLQSDAESFSYAFEALGRKLARHQKNDDLTTQLVEESIELANSFLNKMDRQGIDPTEPIIRNYVEFLCVSGELRTAYEVVRQCATTNTEDGTAAPHLLNTKTVYRAAMANAKAGNLVEARELALAVSEPIPFLLENIAKLEQGSS